jgi:hypothetical protein
VKRLLCVCLVLLAGCAGLQKRAEQPWPASVTSIETEGDIDMAWRDAKFSGSIALQMDYPDTFTLEVYGAFGQTVVLLKRIGSEFLFVAGDERITSESVFHQRIGMDVRVFMDDIAMRGDKVDAPGGAYIVRDNYRVTYGHDKRGRRMIRWEGTEGRISLTLTDETFNGGSAGGGNRSRNP